MSIDAKQLRELVIRPTLSYLELWSEEAEDLLMGTAAQESHLGTYLMQLGGGPALGIFQMEPATHKDILVNYLSYRKDLESKVGASDEAEGMVGNLYYATVMARIHYLRVPEALPNKSELSDTQYVQELASYWKSYYNTPLGKGTVEEFIENYRKYVK